MSRSTAYNYSVIKRIISIILVFVMVITTCHFERQSADAYTSVGDWGFDLYYMNENDTHVTHKTDSFSLKYAFKFDTNVDIEPFMVHIKLNAELFPLRADAAGKQTSVLPKQIGVPEGGYTNGTYKQVESLKSSFNYYYTTEIETDPVTGDEKEVTYLNFYNYKALSAGFQNIVEVMYDDIDIFDVYDGQKWQIDADVTVDKPIRDDEGNVVLDEELNSVVESKSISSEEGDFLPLTGDVDSYVSLSSLTKIAFKDSSVSYTPGLYTRNQVERFIGKLPSDSMYINADGTLNTADYIYMVWKSTVTGSSTQPWTLYIDDLASRNSGSVLGLGAEVAGVGIVPGTPVTLYVTEQNGAYHYFTEAGEGRTERTVYYASGTDVTNKNYTNYNVNKMRKFTLNYYIVTVYDKSRLEGYLEGEEYELTNDIAAVLQSADDHTSLQYKDAADLVGDGSQYETNKVPGTHNPYRWNYKNDEITLKKSPKTKTDLYAWFDANVVTKKETGRWGRFEYEVTGDIRSYATTHTGVYNGSYLTYTGGYAVTEISDDLLYVKDHGKNPDGAYADGIATGTYDGITKLSPWSILTPEDYYYSGVKISLKEIGYDPFEDKTDSELLSDEIVKSVDANYQESSADGWNRDWEIYVCKDPSNPYSWELLKTVTWEEYLAGKNAKNEYLLELDEATLDSAFRIKVLHKSVDYNATVKLNPTVTIKDTSPVFNAMYNESQATYEGTNTAKYDERAGYTAIIENEASLAASRKGLTNGIYYDPVDKVYYISDEDLTVQGFKCIASNNQSISQVAKNGNPGAYDVDSKGYNRTNRADITKQETEKLYADSETIVSTGEASPEVIRAFADNNLLPQQKHASSIKTSHPVSNSATGRINITYTLAAYEGYKVYSDVAKNNLVYSGAQIDRKVVEFYDLLPYKVSYDGSVAPTIGRLETTTDNYMADANRNWDESQLVLTSTEITENYRGTGRTMVKFVITYTGEDPTKFDPANYLWYAGYGIRFSTYVDWTDYEDSKNQQNISAYMPGGDQSEEPIIGNASEVSKDNGVDHPANLNSVWTSEYCYFDTNVEDFVPYLGPDINGDGKTGEEDPEKNLPVVRNVLYASSPAFGQFATSASLGIVKTVKADDEATFPFAYTANVGYGKDYTYDLTLTNTENKLSNIVIFDRIENTIANVKTDNLSTEDLDFPMDNKSWCGQLKDIDILSLINNKKILVKVYYSENRNVDFPIKVTTTATESVDVDILSGKTLDKDAAGDWKELIIYEIVPVDAKGNRVDPSDAAFSKYTIKCTKDLLQGIGGDKLDPSKVHAIAVDAREAYYVDENDVIHSTPFELGKGESLNLRYKMTAPQKKEKDGESIFENGYGITVSGNNTTYEEYTPDMVYAYNTPYYYSCLNNKYSLLAGNITAVKLGDTEELIVRKEIALDQYEYLKDTSKLTDTSFVFKLLNDEGKSCMDKKYQVWEYVGLSGDYDITDSSWVKISDEAYRSKKTGEIVDTEGYVLLDAGEYKTVPESSTIRLKHNQKAVFKDVRNARNYTITEKESLLWVSKDDINDQAVKEDELGNPYSVVTHSITNTYQPIIYINKTVSGVSSLAGDKQELSFTYQVLDEKNQPVVGAKYYLVKSANLSSSPVILTAKDSSGKELPLGGTTDENGMLTFKASDTVALLLPEQLGTEVKLVEVLPEDSDWVCTVADNTITTTVEAKSKKVSFENVYIYKDLEIKKAILHDHLISTEELSKYNFSFRIGRYDENATFTYLGYEEVKALYDSGRITAVNAEGASISVAKIMIESDGTITAPIGNGTLTIAGIPGFYLDSNGKMVGYSYYVRELVDSEHLSKDFKADKLDAVVKYLPKSSKVVAELSNDYQKRNLTVTKQVAADADDLKKDADKYFTLYLKDGEGSPVGGAAFTSNDSNRTKPLVTGSDGSFEIKAFEVVTFKTIGRENELFYMAEKVDDKYIPLSLPYTPGDTMTGDSSFRLKTEGEDSFEYKVLNGGKDYLVIRKNYVGLDEQAKTHLEELLSDESFCGLTISATLRIQCPDGVYYPVGTYEIPANGLYVVNLKQLTDKLYTEKGFALPTDYEQVSYKVEEQEVMPQLENGMTADGKSVTYTVFRDRGEDYGKVHKDQVASLVNNLDSMIHESKIYKYNYLSKPNQGAEMTWILQEYNGSKWVSKEGIRYQIYDGKDSARSEVLTTDKSGRITIYYSSAPGTYSAYVALEAENVYLNVKNPKIGDLRIVETGMELDGWGYPIGIGTDEKFTGQFANMNAGEMPFDEKGDVLINSREFAELEVEKKVVGQIVDDTAFEFTLSAMLGGNANTGAPGTDMIYGAGLDYRVYSSLDDSYIRTGKTSENGTFTLIEGQYARITVPKYMDWKVEESKTLHWTLNEVTNNDGSVSDDVLFGSPSDTGDNVMIGILPQNAKNFYYTGNVQEYVVEKSGYYKLEAWGAQGYGYNNYKQNDPNYDQNDPNWFNHTGGKGAYTTGTVYLEEGDVLYVYVGESPKLSEDYINAAPTDATIYASPNYTKVNHGTGVYYPENYAFNGGGFATAFKKLTKVTEAIDSKGGPGGGATDFRLVKSKDSNGVGAVEYTSPSKQNSEHSDLESLQSRIMVAAGGGGTGFAGYKYSLDPNYNPKNEIYFGVGGSGGALTGIAGTGGQKGSTGSDGLNYGTGGSQRAGGDYYKTGSEQTRGQFGIGGAGSYNDAAGNGSNAGGSGYYGGGGNTRPYGGGGGGSSYIKGYEDGSNKCDVAYVDKQGDYEFIDMQMIAGVEYTWNATNGTLTPNNVKMPQPDGSIKNGHEGDGFARVTFVGENKDDGVFQYTGEIQTYVVPKDGYYKLEAWGAQGGYRSEDSNVGGKGAYTSGIVYLTEGQKIYVAVGQMPDIYTEDIKSGEVRAGGWNGGGSVAYAANQNNGASGGGATDFRLVADESNLKKWDDAGSLQSRIMVAAGGGGGSGIALGGSGGALTGIRGCSGSTNYEGYYSNGGTQNAGGTAVSESAPAGSFGKGGSVNSGRTYGGNGGGGGYYGGGATSRPHGGAGGGSSYVNGYTGCDTTYYNKDYVFIDAKMIAGVEYAMLASSNHPVINEFEMPQPDGSISNGHEGNGCAKITFITDTVELPYNLPEGDPVSIIYAKKYDDTYKVVFAPVTDTSKVDSYYNYTVDTTDVYECKTNDAGGRYLLGLDEKKQIASPEYVVDAKTGQYVNMVRGDVTIPEYIVTIDRNGLRKKHKVVAIYSGAYGRTDADATNAYTGSQDTGTYGIYDPRYVNDVITGLYMADTIEAIGARAINNIGAARGTSADVQFTGDLYFSKKLKYIGNYNCLGSVDTPLQSAGTIIFNCDTAGLQAQSKNLFGGTVRNRFFKTAVIGAGFTKSVDDSEYSYGTKSTAFSTFWVEGSIPTILYSDSLTEIGGTAFNSRSGLSAFLPITYTDSVYTYKDGRVVSCETPKYEFYNEAKKAVNAAAISKFSGSCIFSGELTTIGSYAFQNCSKLKGDLVIDCSVEKLNAEIFSGTPFAGALRISHGFNQIQKGNGGTSVSYDATQKVMTFQSVFGGMSVINSNTFTSIDFDFRNIDTDMQHTTCMHCGKVLPRMDFAQTSIFTGWPSIRNVAFGSAVRNIGNAANGSGGPLLNRNTLRSLVLSEGIEIIGDRMFQDNNYLGNITGTEGDPKNQKLSIPSTVTKVGRCAFRSCYGFSGLEFRGAENGSSKVTELYPYSIQQCRNMKGTLVIPESVQFLDTKCLHSSAFATIVFMGSTTDYNIKGNFVPDEKKNCIFDFGDQDNSWDKIYPVQVIYVNENALSLLSSLKNNKVESSAQGWVFGYKSEFLANKYSQYTNNDLKPELASIIQVYETGTTPWK